MVVGDKSKSSLGRHVPSATVPYHPLQVFASSLGSYDSIKEVCFLLDAIRYELRPLSLSNNWANIFPGCSKWVAGSP